MRGEMMGLEHFLAIVITRRKKIARGLLFMSRGGVIMVLPFYSNSVVRSVLPIP